MNHKLNDGLKVSLIATPLADFSCCSLDEQLSDVVQRNVDKFDFMPVRNRHEDIIGLVELHEYFESAPPQGTISDHMEPLMEKYLIGADSSILAFLLSADERKFRFVISQEGIVGLISLSDIQNIPVRVTLFSLITSLEIQMLDSIRRSFRSAEGWQSLLTPGRLEKVQSEIHKAQSSEGAVEALLYTQFCDKRDILLKSLFKEHPERQQLKRILTDAETLRNALAHANEFAVTLANAATTCSLVREIIWAERLIGELDAE